MKTLIKKLALAGAIVTATIGVQAQSIITGGVIGGVSTSTVEISNLDRAADNVWTGRDIKGYEAGLYAQLRFGSFYIRPQAMYSFQGGTLQSNTDVPGTDYRTHNFQLPLLFGFRILGPLSVEAGPVYNHVLNVNEQYNGIIVQQNRDAVGYRAGLMLDLNKILILASYEGITYKNGSGGVMLKQPSRLMAGLGIRVGGGSRSRGVSNHDFKRVTRLGD